MLRRIAEQGNFVQNQAESGAIGRNHQKLEIKKLAIVDSHDQTIQEN